MTALRANWRLATQKCLEEGICKGSHQDFFFLMEPVAEWETASLPLSYWDAVTSHSAKCGLLNPQQADKYFTAIL